MVMNALEKLAHWCVNAELQNSSLSFQLTRDAFIDTSTHALRGVNSPCYETLINSKAVWGNGECTIIGTNEKTAAVSAALINASLSNAEDCSAYDNVSLSHSPCSIIAAMVALSQHLEHTKKTPINGKLFCHAFCIGMEVLLRIAKALNPSHYYGGWHTSATLNAFGATAACAVLLKLGHVQFADALSMTTSRISGYKLQFGSMTKILHTGFAAESGVICAMLVANGANARHNTFDDAFGLCDLHGGKNPPDFSEALSDVTGGIEGMKHSLLEKTKLAHKPYPCCAFLHPIIDKSLHIHNAVDNPSDIEYIEVTMPQKKYEAVRFECPKDAYQARFSLKYCLISAILFGNIDSNTFEKGQIEEMLADPLFTSLQARINVIPLVDDANDADNTHGSLSIHLPTNKIEMSLTHALGTPENPLSSEAIDQKFLTAAAPVIENPEHVLIQLNQLSDVPAIGRLVQQLAAKNSN